MSDAVAHAINHYAFDLGFIPRPAAAAQAKAGQASHSKYVGDLLRK